MQAPVLSDQKLREVGWIIGEAFKIGLVVCLMNIANRTRLLIDWYRKAFHCKN